MGACLRQACGHKPVGQGEVVRFGYELNRLRSSGYRLTSTADGCVLVTVAGRTNLVRLRLCGGKVELAGPNERLELIELPELLAIVALRLGPATEPWSQVSYVL